MKSVPTTKSRPGVYADFQEEARSVLESIPVLNEKVMTATQLPQEMVVPVMSEVLKFLFLIGKTGQRLTPSLIVDLAWHEFILCTRHYHDYCDSHFGRYIHHHPGGDEKQNNQQFLLTLETYHELLGTPPEQFWGSLGNSNCGICEAI